MDALTGLLDGPRARGAFLLRAMLDPPWATRIQDEAPLSLVVVTRGSAWVIPDDIEPTPLEAGDVAIMRGPDHYTFADDPATAPQMICHPGQLCTTPDGEDLADAWMLGVRTWGNSPEGSTTMLIGTYQLHGVVGQRLIEALPPTIVLRRDEWDARLADLLADEIVRDEPGQESVLDRLLDLMVIAALRAWLARPDADPPAWYSAHRDPIVGKALRRMHDAPARPWTVAAIAREIGISRAAFARRFADAVGEPPMTYLTNWRLALAADLLHEPHTTIAAVADRVGYGSPFALSTAFKRAFGISPHQHRQRATADDPAAEATG